MRIGVPIAVMVVMLSAVSYSADSTPKGDASSAKIYVIYLDGGRSYVLEGVEGVDFNGVKCLKGRHADITWAKGRICYIPVGKISAIMEYDSLDQYMQDIQKYRDSQLK